MEIRIDIEDVTVSVNFTNVSEALEERMTIAESDIDSLEADVATNAADILANTALINTKAHTSLTNLNDDVDNQHVTTTQIANWNDKADRIQEDWVTPTLLNGATPFSETELYGYMKDEFGFVHLRGLIKPLGIGGSYKMFDLPLGYRPVQNLFLPALSNYLLGAITITSSGVYPSKGYVDWISLDGISFKAEEV